MWAKIENDIFFLNALKDNLLSITDDGLIFNTKTGKQIGKTIQSDGYIKISFKGKQIVAHRLIWLKFNGAIEDKLEVNHIDGIKSNNKLDNLELVTTKGNADHARKLGLLKPQIGENNSQSKFLDEEVIKIRKRYVEEKISINKLAKEYNVTKTCISYILQGKTYKHLPILEYHTNETNLKYSKEDAEEILKLSSQGLSSYKIAKIITKLSRATIQRIIYESKNSQPTDFIGVVKKVEIF